MTGQSDDPVLRALAPWLGRPERGVLLAVSGGPDSSALMHAALG
ncbi:tRNA lysidine(34) synthetase TilS, partial [Methylobacterium sp. WL18]